MQIERFSLKALTIAIFIMIGVVAIVLSLLAGSYFRQAALDAQIKSLSRVIEVASQEMLKQVRGYTFDLGMRLGNSPDVIQALNSPMNSSSHHQLEQLLDDPFINGFVGFSNVSLEKIRIYNLDYELIAASHEGLESMNSSMPAFLRQAVENRHGVERLKAMDVLWVSANGPLNSTLVPVGGLRLLGYLEVVVNPAFNLPDISKITKTPVSVGLAGDADTSQMQHQEAGFLPVEYILPASDGQPAFRIIGYENVSGLNQSMTTTQWVTTGGFLFLSLSTLAFALWLFNRFLFKPLGRMIQEMKQMTQGKLELTTVRDREGVSEISILADSFDAMANQVIQRTNDLERLLELDGSAIMCFGYDNEAVYFNKSASQLLGYGRDEVAELDAVDVFAENIFQSFQNSDQSAEPEQKSRIRVNCCRRDGSMFECEAVINPLSIMGGYGYAVVMHPVHENDGPRQTQSFVNTLEQNEQRMNAIEQSLNSILELARKNPGVVNVIRPFASSTAAESITVSDRSVLRETVVNVMTAALACWEHELGKSKLEFAEQSGIWPVYIDKSTPTTRTLDKYLHIDSCPQKPRSQRVIDSAEFVLRQVTKPGPYRQKLVEALSLFRATLSGVSI